MATKKTETINLLPLKKERYIITITGDTPLIIHSWGEKAKKEMLDKQMKVTKTKGKDIRNPFAEFLDALYWITDRPAEDTEESFYEAVKNGAKFGFPVTGIKQATQSTLYRLGAIPNQMLVRGAFFIKGYGKHQLAEIITPEPPECVEDMVKIGSVSKVSDLRYRPYFNNWQMKLEVEYTVNSQITFEQIVNGIEYAGAMNGIGEWRIERDGPYGKFHVENVERID